jgi:type VI secretion system protein ImpF
VSDLRLRDRLQPALLDRLTNHGNAEAPRTMSSRELRRCVRRDLEWLLNTVNLESIEDLSDFPQVASSVVNYGVPGLSGRTLATMEPEGIAGLIRLAIQRFEPRLSQVRVVHEPVAYGADEQGIAFRIEAELWGNPQPQRMEMRTSFDVDSRQVAIADLGGG